MSLPGSGPAGCQPVVSQASLLIPWPFPPVTLPGVCCLSAPDLISLLADHPAFPCYLWEGTFLTFVLHPRRPQWALRKGINRQVLKSTTQWALCRSRVFASSSLALLLKLYPFLDQGIILYEIYSSQNSSLKTPAFSQRQGKGVCPPPRLLHHRSRGLALTQ